MNEGMISLAHIIIYTFLLYIFYVLNLERKSQKNKFGGGLNFLDFTNQVIFSCLLSFACNSLLNFTSTFIIHKGISNNHYFWSIHCNMRSSKLVLF